MLWLWNQQSMCPMIGKNGTAYGPGNCTSRAGAPAQILDVSPSAVSQWFGRAATVGSTALYHHASPGAPPKLTTEQKAQIPTLLAKGAEAYGFRGNLWTAARVASVLARTFHVHLLSGPYQSPLAQPGLVGPKAGAPRQLTR